LFFAKDKAVNLWIPKILAMAFTHYKKAAGIKKK
jgi:hypothetical protein